MMAPCSRRNLTTLWALLALIGLCMGFSEKPTSEQKVLVLLDEFDIQETHSVFFSSLQDRGYQLDFKLAQDTTLETQKYGEFIYDSMIIFAPKSHKLAEILGRSTLLDFIDSGHDVILAGAPEVSDFVRDIANECGVDFDEEANSVVIDHSNFIESEQTFDHTLIVSDEILNDNAFFGSSGIEGPILYQGIASYVNPASDLVLPVLTGSETSFSAKASTVLKSIPNLKGKSLSLVSVMQARNNARVLISGSLSLFSDKFFNVKFNHNGKTRVSANEKFVIELSKWALHEKSHIKAGEIKHHKINEKSEPSVYRINDDLEVSVEILEWNGLTYVPYSADDVQVQFYMMSPYVLQNLTHDGKGIYSTQFKVPDVYGVFQIKVEYKRLGFSTLSLTKQIPVRPFKHDEYERFISSAFPYYTSVFSMMAGFFVLGFVILYHK